MYERSGYSATDGTFFEPRQRRSSADGRPRSRIGRTTDRRSFDLGLGQGKTSEADEKLFAMLAHLLGIVSSFIGALVIWQIKKDESPFITDQGKEALNFQITLGIAYIVLMLLSFIPVVGCFTTILIVAVSIAGIVFSILGGLDANKGKAYRYPFALRLVK